MSFLQQIYLDGNGFTSKPNNFLLGLPSLEIFSLGDCSLDPWELPAYLAESTNLATFYASSVNITGIIPDIFGSFPNLQDLRLSYNNLSGSLPRSFSGSGIQKLWLNNQNQGLSGTLDVLSNMTQLSDAWLHANAFTGGIPDLSKCTNLVDLQLRENHLTGVVPPSLMNLPKLTHIELQNNKLQGPYPQFPKNVDATIGDMVTNSYCSDKPGPCDPQVNALLAVARALGYPLSLADSWKGNNACTWRFIVCDSQQRNVTVVNMGKQGFTGTISPAFANLTSLRTLVLSDNNLSGEIPAVLTTLPQIQSFDVSNNNLVGPIPLFRNTVTFKHDGNSMLGKNASSGGGGGGDSGGGANPGNADGSSKSSKKSVSAGMIAGVVIAVLVFIGIVLFVSYKYCLKKRAKKYGGVVGSEKGKEMVIGNVVNGVNRYPGGPSELRSQSSDDHNDIHIFEGGNVSISIDVLRQVTNNFNEENILGRGGFGVVYKGELHDGTKIAVKRMESGAMGTKGMKEFQAEIDVLTKVRHRHLVALLGYCINGNERLLVYEYMPQGTLSQHLFEWSEHGSQPLTWKQRVTIALDVARGIEYLHSLAQQSFIHRDMKPTNILLSDDMRAKVADFGLVRNAPDGKYSVETRLAGTFGYLAPEYAGKY